MPATTFREFQNFEVGPVPQNGLSLKFSSFTDCPNGASPVNTMVYNNNYVGTIITPTFDHAKGCAAIRCQVPECGGISQTDPSFREGLWSRYFTAAPRPRTPSELRYSDRRLRSKSWQLFGSQLDERGRRHFAAVGAMTAGRGVIVAVHEITGIARSTIGRGIDELEASDLPEGRVRREGAGRGRWRPDPRCGP
jgi:hypothetical protein